MKKLIIFDCDGTLVDSEIIASRVFTSVWRSMGLDMTEDYFLCNFVGAGNDTEIVKSTLAKLPPNTMEIADKKFDEELATNLKPVKGMTELLVGLDHELCVASNSSLEYVKRALATTGLSHFFGEKVYSARDLNKPKPAPDLFLHAANELGFTPQQCLVIEDSVSGVQAAKNAHMKVIGFLGGLHCNQVVTDKLLEARADHYCRNTGDLQSFLCGGSSNFLTSSLQGHCY